MTRTLTELKRSRSRFGWVFVISLVILIASTLPWFALPTPTSQPPTPSPSPPPPRLPDTISLAMLISVASLLTSLASLGGFFFTTLVAWRKERREQKHADVELEKKKLEVEKLRIELEQRRSQTPPTGGKSGDVG